MLGRSKTTVLRWLTGNHAFYVFFFSFVLSDLLTHWNPALRNTWEFLPTERGGDTNEFVTLWVDLFSRAVRAGPFTETFWFLNPRVAFGDTYSSHPGLLTFLAAIWQSLFGESPQALRILAMLLFSLRLTVFHELVRRWLGLRGAYLALALYLAIPATQSYTHALSFEVIAGTFVLLCFWAQQTNRKSAPLFAALAAATDYTAILAFLATRKRRVWVGAVLAAAASIAWAHSHGGVAAQAGRVRDYLIGPFFVLTANAEARALLLHRLWESFPLFVAIPFLFDLKKNGIRGREPWWIASLIGGGLLILCFLGVFRVHAYLSSLAALAVAASAARMWERVWQTRRVLGYCLVMLLGFELRTGFQLPIFTLEHAQARKDFTLEIRELEPFLRGKTVNVRQDDSLLRPKPVENLLPLSRFTWAPCAEATIALDGLGSECQTLQPAGRHTQLKHCPCR